MLRKLGLVACRSFAGRGCIGADVRLRWGWHGGWPAAGIAAGADRALLCRRPGLCGYGYGGCYVRRLVPTPWGPRWRLVNRCY